MAKDTTALTMRRPSPFAALLWEEWRQTRRGILTGLAWALPLILLPLWQDIFGDGQSRQRDDDSFPILLAFALFVWLAGTLLFSGYGRNDLHVTFPRRLFVLPLSTDGLVLVRLGYSLVVMALIFTGLGWLISFDADTSYALQWVPTLAVLGVLYVFALGWGFGRRPLAAALVAMPLWLIVAVLFRGLLEFSGALRSDPFVGPNAVAAAALPVAVLLAGIAWAGVAYDRNGRLYPAARAWSVLRQAPRLFGRNAEGFATPGAAQTWLEWRRRGRWVLVFCLGMSLAVATVWTLLDFSVLPGLVVAAWVGIPSGTIAAGFFQLLVSERDRVSGLSRFALTRPCSTAALAAARLKALAAGLFVAYATMGLLNVILAEATAPGGVRPLLDEMYSMRRETIVETRPQPAAALRQPRGSVHFGQLQLGLQPANPSLQAEALPATGAGEPARQPPLAGASANPAPTPAIDANGPLRTEARQAARTASPYWQRPAPPATPQWQGISTWAYMLWLALIPVLTLLVGWVLLTETLPVIVLAVVLAAFAESKVSPYALDAGFLLSALVIFVAAILLFRQAYRLKLLRGSTLRLVVLGWLVVFYMLGMWNALSGFDFRDGFDLPIPGAFHVFVAALALLPFLPLATTTLSIHRQRHG